MFKPIDGTLGISKNTDGSESISASVDGEGGGGPIDPSTIDHNQLLNYDPSEHIDWTNTTQDFKTSGDIMISGDVVGSGNTSLNVGGFNSLEIGATDEYKVSANPVINTHTYNDQIYLTAAGPTGNVNTILSGEFTTIEGGGSAGISVNATEVVVQKSLKYTGAPATAGNVLTTDATGSATWQPPSVTDNIYIADGTLTGDRLVDGADFDLTMDNTSLVITPTSAITSSTKAVQLISEGQVGASGTFGLGPPVLIYYNFASLADLTTDVSGNQRNSINNSVGYTSSDLGRSNIADFNSPSYFDLNSYISVFQNIQTLSVSLWFKFTSPISGPQVMVSFSDSTDGATDLLLYLRSGNLLSFQLRLNNTIQFRANSNVGLNVNIWYHVVAQTDPLGGVKLYLDGVLQNNVDTTTNTTANLSNFTINSFLVGANRDDGGLEFYKEGSINELLFMNEVITPETITDLSNDIVGYDVYMLAGQSNMIGRATLVGGIDDDYTALLTQFFQYPYDVNDSGTAGIPLLNGTTITPATNPLDHISDTTGGSGGETAGSMGLWRTASLQLAPSLLANRRVLLVPTAKGGTGFSGGNWNQGDPIYNGATQAVNQALSLNSLNTLRGVLWHQGEADVGSPSGFLSALQNMYNAFIVDINQFTTSTPFICASILTAGFAPINADLQTFASSNTAVEYIDATDLTLFDGVHFDAPSTRTLGDRYGETIKNAILGGGSGEFLGFGTAGTPVVSLSSSNVFEISTDFKFTGSTPINGYVLGTDASGNASWVENANPTTLSLEDGTLTNLSLNFINSTSSGIYRNSSGNVNFVKQGIPVADFNSDCLRVNNSVCAQNFKINDTIYNPPNSLGTIVAAYTFDGADPRIDAQGNLDFDTATGSLTIVPNVSGRTNVLQGGGNLEIVDSLKLAQFNTYDNFSCSFWLQPSGSPSIRFDDGVGSSIVIGTPPGSPVIRLTFIFEGTTIINTSTSGIFGQFNHVALTIGSGGCKLWVNNVLEIDDPVTTNFTNFASLSVIRVNPTGTGSYFDDIVFIANTIGTAEVNDLFNDNLTLNGTPEFTEISKIVYDNLNSRSAIQLTDNTDIITWDATSLSIPYPLQYSGSTPSAGAVLTSDATGNATWQALPALGEVNTASNVGAGIGVFLQKTGTDLEFRTIESNTLNVSGTIDTVRVDLPPQGITAGTYGSGTEAVQLTLSTEGIVQSVGVIPINHDLLTGFVANEHIDWTNTTDALSAGAITTSPAGGNLGTNLQTIFTGGDLRLRLNVDNNNDGTTDNFVNFDVRQTDGQFSIEADTRSLLLNAKSSDSLVLGDGNLSIDMANDTLSLLGNTDITPDGVPRLSVTNTDTTIANSLTYNGSTPIDGGLLQSNATGQLSYVEYVVSTNTGLVATPPALGTGGVPFEQNTVTGTATVSNCIFIFSVIGDGLLMAAGNLNIIDLDDGAEVELYAYLSIIGVPFDITVFFAGSTINDNATGNLAGYSMSGSLVSPSVVRLSFRKNNTGGNNINASVSVSGQALGTRT